MFSTTLEGIGFYIKYMCGKKVFNAHNAPSLGLSMTTSCQTQIQQVILSIIKEIRIHFGDLSIVRENKHTLLGMNIVIKKN